MSSAISSGGTISPIARAALTASTPPRATAEISYIDVWTIPGATTYERIPSAAWLRAIVWATLRTAAFDAA